MIEMIRQLSAAKLATLWLATLLAALALGAVGRAQLGIVEKVISEISGQSPRDNDGVPRLTDYKKPVVDGVRVKKRVFLDTYCEGRVFNETCITVQKYVTFDRD